MNVAKMLHGSDTLFQVYVLFTVNWTFSFSSVQLQFVVIVLLLHEKLGRW